MPRVPTRADGHLPIPHRLPIVGAAVLEGVALRSARATVVAVRRPSGEVVVRLRLRRRRPWVGAMLKVPLLRGVVTLLEGGGLYALAMLFALQQADLFGALPRAAVGAGHLPRASAVSASRRRLWGRLAAWAFWAALGLLLVLGGVPLIFADFAQDAGTYGTAMAPWCHALGAMAAVALMTGYVTLVGHTAALRGLLIYHGAEHRVRAAFAAGAPLTLSSVRTYPTVDAHCAMGRSVVLVAMGFAISPVLGWIWPHIAALLHTADASWGRLAQAAAVRGLCVILAAAPYDELRRLAQTWPQVAGPIGHLLAGPARYLCAGTVTEPDDAALEVALAALLRLIDGESAYARGTPQAPAVAFAHLADAWRKNHARPRLLLRPISIKRCRNAR